MFLMHQDVANQTILKLPEYDSEISKWVVRDKLEISELQRRGFGDLP